MPNINVLTFNARGLRQVTKRRTVFRYLHQHYPTHIAVVQETHSTPRDLAYWQAEWGAPVYLSHGPSTNECGVTVLLPRTLLGTCDVRVQYNAENGRLLILDLVYEHFTLSLVAVYAPTHGHTQQQLSFINNLNDKLNASVDDR